jgi:dTDP-4-amino-4,6-dideoxygalactose transaminase
MDIILDDAQSFPATGIDAAYKTLISFGVTKRLNGCGGGGMYIPDNDERNGLVTHVKQNVKKANDEMNSLLHIASVKLKKMMGYKRPLEAELPVYVEKNAKKALQQKMEVFLMNDLQYATAAKRLGQLRKEQGALSTLYGQLAAFAEGKFGTDCTEPNKGLLSFPTIFALRFPAGERYDNSAYLAGLGIQTTWYYYPIHKISSFSGYESELTPNTDLLSAQVLMLPFGLGHVLRMKRQYMELLKKAGS